MNENTKTIREICEQYGMGQTALARRFGIPIRTVQDWYSGKSKPAVYVVNMIDELLQIEVGTPERKTVREIREGMELIWVTEETCGLYKEPNTGEHYMIIGKGENVDEWTEEETSIYKLIG